MTSTRERYEVMRRLQDLGISYEDANRLRRISMTLQRWFELECGDGNEYGSWAIERDESDYWLCKDCKNEMTDPLWLNTYHSCAACQSPNIKHHIATNKPFLVHHHYLHGHGKDYTTRTRIPDREMGARKRLAKMMEKYPDLAYYIQTDPRGASLYILRHEDVKGQDIDSVYNRGVAVY